MAVIPSATAVAATAVGTGSTPDGYNERLQSQQTRLHITVHELVHACTTRAQSTEKGAREFPAAARGSRGSTLARCPPSCPPFLALSTGAPGVVMKRPLTDTRLL